MYRSARLLVFISALSFFLSAASFAQNYPYAGFPMFSTQLGSQYDQVDIADGNISLLLPLRNIPAGPMPLNYVMFGASNVYAVYDNPNESPNYLWQVTIPWFNILPPMGARVGDNPTGNAGTCNGQYDSSFSNFYVADNFGTVHPLPTSIIFDQYGCWPVPVGTYQTTDGSGYTMILSGTNASWTTKLYDKNGLEYPAIGSDYATYSVVSPDQVTLQTIASGGSCNAQETMCTDTSSITDALTTTPILSSVNTSGAGVSNPTQTYTYTNFDGSVISPAPFTMNYSQYTGGTNFGCSNIAEGGAGLLPSSITTPSGTYSFTYETTPGKSQPNVTGRIASITLPSGGSISYTYAGGNNGINCNSNVVPTLTRTVNDNNGNISKWTYVNSNSSVFFQSNFTVVVTDPAKNQTAYNFQGQFQTQVNSYQGGCQTGTTGCVGGGSLLKTVTTCYNGVFTNCATPSTITGPPTANFSQTDVFTAYNGGKYNLVETKFDTLGNTTEVKQYNFVFTAVAAPTGTPLSDTVTYYGQSWNGTSCTAYPAGVYIYTTPCYSYTNSSGTTVAKTQITYSNTGHPTTTSKWTGSTFLSSTAAYNSNGTVNTFTDVNGTVSTYGYNGSCNGLLPTSVAVGGLTTPMVWNCDGAVVTRVTDPNGAQTNYAYNDPLWRITSMTDPLLNVTNYNYPSATTFETVMNFGSISTSDTLVTTNGVGQPIFTQKRQAQGSSTFDSVQTTYGWTSGVGAVTTVSVPYAGTAGQPAPQGTAVNKTQFDALGRSLSAANSATGGYNAFTYTNNDVLSVLGPAPSGENLKQTQSQSDGLGRPTSSCNLSSTASGNVSCAQNNGSYNGVLTATSYSSASGSQTITSTRGSQTRSQTADGLGRVTSSATPEGGTITNVYDSITCGGAYNFPGKLVMSTFANGNFACYDYDSLGRLLDISAGYSGGGTSLCRRFRYDNSTGVLGTIPSGITISNPYGRMVEAETDNCVQPLTTSSIITDEWFSYDKDGNMSDMWELTPHSGQYYHSTAIFAANGALTSLQLVSPSLYTIAYGLDGEGRWDTLAKGSSLMVTGPTPPNMMYNAAGQAIEVDLTGSDKDLYTYNFSGGNMTNYEFEVGGANETGMLNWNPNNTLKSLTITDGFNSGGSQTCYFNPTLAPTTGYDDLGRLMGMDCGSGNWGQDFSYDQYDNLTQTVISGRSGSTWNPGYSSSPSNNHVTGATYDASGNMTNDGGMNVYGYDAYNKLLWTAGSGTPTCGTSGKCITYDAFGRMVEKSNAATWTEIWYTQIPGSMINMSGATANYGYWPSPGRGTFVASGSNIFFHQDWLGNDRVVSNLGSNTVLADRAYAPYGEQYNAFGSTNPVYGMFAEMTADFDSGVLFDTPNRELAQYQGRWVSPDPAGAGWNQYAYATNPLSNVDPTGLQTTGVQGQCANHQNTAICQGGYLTTGGGLTFTSGFFNTWDEFGGVTTTNTTLQDYTLDSGTVETTGHILLDQNGNIVDFGATSVIKANGLTFDSQTNTWNIGSGGNPLSAGGTAANNGTQPPGVPKPPNPILQYDKCVTQNVNPAKNNAQKVSIINGVTNLNGLGLCAFTGPDAPLCVGVLGGVATVNSLVFWAGGQITVYDAETQCLQQN